MAAQVLLLLPLISNIHAELILRAGSHHLFNLDRPADFCSVSRWTSEGKQLLWNSSGSYYLLRSLAVSHSGQYQVQCWTRGNVTLERKSTLLVCDDQKMRKSETVNLIVGETVELSCDGVGPNQSVQWAYDKNRGRLSLLDDGTPPEHELQQVKNNLLLTVTKDSSPFYYFCLDKQQLRCELHSAFFVEVVFQFIFRSVGESLELNCSEGSQYPVVKWEIFTSLGSVTQSLTSKSDLFLPSLALNDSGTYSCQFASGRNDYYLYVCPEPGPPAVELFTGGMDFTLHCGSWRQTDRVHWFMRSNRTNGQVTTVSHRLPDHMYLYGSRLVIRNISLRDSGQFWCVVERGRLYVFRLDFLVMFGEPEVDHHLLRSVLLSAVVLMMLGVAVGVKVWRSRRREQVPAPVEELEMSQLSPEADVQEEAPV